MIRSFSAAGVIATLWSAWAVASEPPAAELRALGTEGAVMRVRVEEISDGYQFVVRCESGCPAPVAYTEDVSDVPLGVLQLWDGDGLLISTWAAASVYVVRIYLLAPHGVSRVLEVTGSGAPGLALDGRGRLTVSVSERWGGARNGFRKVLWRWNGARFERSSP